LQLEKVISAKVSEEKGMLVAKLEESEAFLLCISKKCFFQSVCQDAFYHGMPINDDRYDVERDLMECAFMTELIC